MALHLSLFTKCLEAKFYEGWVNSLTREESLPGKQRGWGSAPPSRLTPFSGYGSMTIVQV